MLALYHYIPKEIWLLFALTVVNTKISSLSFLMKFNKPMNNFSVFLLDSSVTKCTIEFKIE